VLFILIFWEKVGQLHFLAFFFFMVLERGLELEHEVMERRNIPKNINLIICLFFNFISITQTLISKYILF